MATTLDVLREARKLIAKGWTQHASARNAAGVEVVASDGRAVSFCAAGACDRAAYFADQRGFACVAYESALAALESEAEGHNVPHHNDNVIGTQAEALDWFNAAIEAEAVRNPH